MFGLSFWLQSSYPFDSALCRVVEIRDPGLLLDRIEGARISRPDAQLVTDRAPDPEDLETDFS